MIDDYAGVLKRRALIARIVRENTPDKWQALREFYALAMTEILAVEPWQWGIDPYEVDWLSVFTPIENWLWFDIRGIGAVFYPQFPVGRYFVDFANPAARVAIECDGAAYHDKEKDSWRDANLARMGWSVYRITGSDCRTSNREIEDANGRVVYAPGAAEKFIEEIAMGHGLTSRAAREEAA